MNNLPVNAIDAFYKPICGLHGSYHLMHVRKVKVITNFTLQTTILAAHFY